MMHVTMLRIVDSEGTMSVSLWADTPDGKRGAESFVRAECKGRETLITREPIFPGNKTETPPGNE